MKTLKYFYKKISLLAICFVLFLGCERDLSDQAVLASFSTTAEIFTDNFIGLGSNFYFPYNDGFAKLETFEVDNNVSYQGNASLRIDVPNSNDPDGVYVGANFVIDGAGRDLTGYDALTFWIKSSSSAVVDEFGFGRSETSDFEVTLPDVQLSTAWRKVIIPIPDPSKLVQEKGVLYMVANPDANGNGYSFWIDELKFEKLGNIGQSRPKIFNGSISDFISIPGQSLSISGYIHTFNLGNGQDVTVESSVNYYEFTSSNPSVATVDGNGLVTVLSTGEAQITATVGGADIEGAVNVRSFDDQRIISLFSDFYANVPVDNYNGFYEPFQTTQGGFAVEDGNNIIDYTDLNFVAMEFYGRSNPNAVPIDATEMTNINIDFRVNESVSPTDFITLELINNFGPGQTAGRFTIPGSSLRAGEFVSFSIPLENFTGGLANRNALGALLFITDGTIRNLSIDNIYFSKEVIEPLPNVDDSAATQFVVPVGYESTTLNYNFFGFAGAEDSSIVTNPVSGDINTSGNVMRTVKANGAQVFAGTAFDFEQSIDLSSSQKVRLKVYSPKADITVRMALELNGGGGQVVIDSNVPVANEWVELEFDFASVYNPATNYGRVIVFMDFDVSGDGSVYYYDDIQIAN